MCVQGTSRGPEASESGFGPRSAPGRAAAGSGTVAERRTVAHWRRPGPHNLREDPSRIRVRRHLGRTRIQAGMPVTTDDRPGWAAAGALQDPSLLTATPEPDCHGDSSDSDMLVRDQCFQVTIRTSCTEFQVGMPDPDWHRDSTPRGWPGPPGGAGLILQVTLPVAMVIRLHRLGQAGP